jgi:M6 family metalloprotease-like protein
MRLPKQWARALLIPFLGLFLSGEAEAARLVDLRAPGIPPAGVPPARLRPFPDVIGGGPLRAVLPGSGRTYEELLKGAAPAPETTFRVAVFRIEFENDSAEGATTGEGRFLLGPNDGSWFIDSPPHDSVYFHTHLEVLRRYYEAQSYGKLRIEWEIFPKSLGAGEYRLHDTAGYLPEGSPASWDLDSRVDGLIRLCKDAITLVDTVDPGVDFSAYDGYMVVHAGPDLQTDVNGDSPGDTPSFFLSFGGEDTVVVDRDAGDSVLVAGMTMIPEYTSQDGFLFGLNGVIAHEFGHQLGLPDLYDTERSWPAVGVWDLMDSGGMVSISAGDFYLGSVIPASLSIWPKLYLGWTVPEIVTSSRDLSLACNTFLDPPGAEPRAALIPLNGEELFLVENRCGLAPPGGYAAKLDTVNNIVLGPITNDDAEEYTYDYDYALPGWGLLIWHINNRKLTQEAVFYTNDVNNDYNDRGLEVEEADGIKDLGNPYSAYWDGSPYDPFFAGNATVFGPSTAPSSNLTDGGKSKVTVRGIGPFGTIMDLTVEVDRSLPGWPVPLLADSTFADPAGLAVRAGEIPGAVAFWAAPDTSSDDSAAVRFGITAVAPAGGLIAVRREEIAAPLSGIPVSADLDPAIGGEEVYAVAGGRLLRVDPGGDPPVRDLGPLAAGRASAGPLLLDVNGDGREEIVVAEGDTLSVYETTSDSLLVVRRDPLESATITVLAATVEEGYPPRVYLVAGDEVIGVDYLTEKRLHATRAEAETGDLPVSLFLADLDRDGTREVVIVTPGGVVLVLDRSLDPLPGWPVLLEEPPTGEPFAADRNGDGYPEIAVPCGARLVLLERNGIRASDTPLEIPPYLQRERRLVGNGVTALLAAEGGAAGRTPPVATDDGGRLWLWTGRETPGAEWPISTGTENVAIGGGPAPDGGAALYALSRDGFLYGFPLEDADPRRFPWRGPGGDGAGRRAFDDTLLRAPEPAEGPPSRLLAAYCYPNPATGERAIIRYSLSAEAEVSISVHDATGGRVARVDGAPGAFGENEAALDIGPFASGVYAVRIAAGSEVKFVKMAVIR